MSETNSLNPLEPTTFEARPASPDAPPAAVAAGHRLFEQIGFGGMGEVYRCGDDALQRDLALKVLKAELHGDSGAEERFLREARLTGSLQHPGIVPVHHLGQLPDGRPCYSMKLVRGRTLADLLRDETDGAERVPRLLIVVEKVCQAMAFAHSKGVIHRDLKPSNVMVGEFGEVQVMDWGLAKELRKDEAVQPDEAAIVETVARPEEDTGLSQAGAALGTPSYMPPEQAAGDWDIVDERADVFALGAMLCELLTGRRPYRGDNVHEVLRRARRGDVADALTQLGQCGADAALVALCRACLSAEPRQRPRHAGVVAERLASYQAEVRERLRLAELERARAEVKAQEQRKRRRLLAALALAALLLLLGGVAAWWQWQRRRAEADGAVAVVLGEAGLLRQQARSDALTPAAYDKAVSAARNAGEMARAGGASAQLRRQADDLLVEVQAEAETAAKDRRLLARLLEVRGPREGPKYSRDDKGTMMALAEPTAEEQFASAFRDWGLDVDATPAVEATARLKERPAVVVTEVSAALDEWTSERRQQGKPAAEWRRLLALSSALEGDGDSRRRELRELMARGRLPVERALGVLSAWLRPVPVPVEVPLGEDRTRLRRWAEKIEPASEPVLGLLTLARALRVAGDEALAERLLRAAIQARPREVVLYHTLGQLLTTQEPPRWAEAVECYAAARALRPDLGESLANALIRGGREREGLALLDRLVKEKPDSPFLHFQQGYALNAKGDLDGAIASYKKAIELDPKNAPAHSNLGVALRAKGDLAGAIASYKKAIELSPKNAPAHTNLGVALSDKGDPDGASACYKKAIELDPKLAQAHSNLGAILCDAKHDYDGAVACFRKAIELDPTLARPHNNLGNALRAKGDVAGAIACYKKAIELDPAYVDAHYTLAIVLYGKGDLDGSIASFREVIRHNPKYNSVHYNLGIALGEKGDLAGALASFRTAVEHDPKHAQAHCNLGNTLFRQGRFAEAVPYLRRGHELGSKQSGWLYPSGGWVREAERLAPLEDKLPAVLRGEASPTDALEALLLAQMCGQFKNQPAAAVRLYAAAFAAEPNRAADLNANHRYHAACSALRAASGQGEDARLLPDKVVLMFRRQALGWLRDDLTAYAKLAANPKSSQVIQQRLARWQSDADLASVRDRAALDRLPDNERAAWQDLWRDVDELAKRMAKK